LIFIDLVRRRPIDYGQDAAHWTSFGVYPRIPCFIMTNEVSIRCQKTPEVGIRRIPAYTPQYTAECYGKVWAIKWPV